jgi:SAM-dependent methyltransferase
MLLKPLFDQFTFINQFVIDGTTYGGSVRAFDDPRFRLFDRTYSVAGARVLELGPLEGVQTIQLHQRGAREIICVEGRVENYYKWCLIKELYHLDRARILLGDLDHVDFRMYGEFDVCLCFGVLYHLDNPADLLLRIAEVTSRVYIWTHFAGPDFPESEDTSLEGHTRDGRAYSYRGRYCREDPELRASLRPDSFWPYETEVLRMLRESGFDQIQLLDSGIMHGRMPVGLIYAEDRTRARRGSAE